LLGAICNADVLRRVLFFSTKYSSSDISDFLGRPLYEGP
jgi:hypothetical protein